MKKLIVFSCFTVSILLCMAFSVSAEYKPNPIIENSSSWIEPDNYVHIGNNSVNPGSEGIFKMPETVSNYFDLLYFTPELINSDIYASSGYYHKNYSRILYDTDTGSFLDSPAVYLMFGEMRTLQPGAVVEFYVYVGDVILTDYDNVNYYYNKIGGVNLGINGGSEFWPIDFTYVSGPEVQISTFIAKNLTGSSSNDRLVQRISIKNSDIKPFSFTAIQLIFQYTDANGNIVDSYIQTGYKHFEIYVNFSAFMLYNSTSRDQAYLDSIGGTIGTFDDKFDSMNDTLISLDDILQDLYDNWNNPEWNGSFDVNLDIFGQEQEVLVDFEELLKGFEQSLTDDSIIAGGGFWNVVYTAFSSAVPLFALICSLAGVYLILRSLLGR